MATGEKLVESLRLFKDIGAEKRLIKDLLDDYDRFSLPRLVLHQPVTVLVDLNVIQFTKLVGIDLLIKKF